MLSELVRQLGLLALLGSLSACGDGTSDPSGPGGGGSGGDGGSGGGTGGDTGGTAGQGGTPTTGTGGTGGGTGGTGGAPAAVCPPGSESITLDLAGASPAPVAGVPPADGYSPGFSILEGPVWIDGALHLSQISTNGSPPAARILRVAAGAEIFLDNAGTNGLAVNDQGQLFGGVHKDGSISRFDIATPGAPPQVVAAGYMGARFNSPNDLAVRSDGNIYFTDPDWQSPKPNPQSAERAYRVTPGGDVQPIGEYSQNGSTATVQKPNGVMLTRDEATLYIGGTAGLYRFPVAADGAVSTGSPVAAVNGGVDGLGKDCAGNLYVTNGQNVVVLGPDDAVLGTIAAGIQVTNVAFGGPDGKTLYITSLGSEPKLLQVPLNVPGYPY